MLIRKKTTIGTKYHCHVFTLCHIGFKGSKVGAFIRKPDASHIWDLSLFSALECHLTIPKLGTWDVHLHPHTCRFRVFIFLDLVPFQEKTSRKCRRSRLQTLSQARRRDSKPNLARWSNGLSSINWGCLFSSLCHPNGSNEKLTRNSTGVSEYIQIQMLLEGN